mmetsp:Transcript_60002/g.119062  ORF Transcript_60002/g.119062 Transcript_60002/m.119062 type:complete len:87 (-) Transcript_60002:475-735(-)
MLAGREGHMHPALPLLDIHKDKQQDHIDRRRGRNIKQHHHALQHLRGHNSNRRDNNRNKPQRLGCVRVVMRVAPSQASGGALCVRN